MRFSLQLQHLNASVVSAQKAAQYALKYKDMDEDLHSCILEQVERVSVLSQETSCEHDCLTSMPQNNMNTRANIMYFIEHFLDLAQQGHAEYVRMMQRDIIRVVDAVAPDDGSGATNVKVVRKVSLPPYKASFASIRQGRLLTSSSRSCKVSRPRGIWSLKPLARSRTF